MELREYINEAIKNDPDARLRRAERELGFRVAVHTIRRRNELGWTQKELADRVGTTQESVSRYESGSANPTARTISRIAHHLRVDVSALVAPVREQNASQRLSGILSDSRSMHWSPKASHSTVDDLLDQAESGGSQYIVGEIMPEEEVRSTSQNLSLRA